MSDNSAMEKIIVLDFGGQYNQLIARRVRQCKVYSEVLPFTAPLSKLEGDEIKGIIFTGGPNSVYDPSSPHVDPKIFSLGKPILGICYGAQLMAYALGGKVEPTVKSEYGNIEIALKGASPFLEGVPEKSQVFMSHNDRVTLLPEGFRLTGSRSGTKKSSAPCLEASIPPSPPPCLTGQSAPT